MKVVSGLNKLEILVDNFFVLCLQFRIHVCTSKKRALCDNLFSEIMKQIVYLK